MSEHEHSLVIPVAPDRVLDFVCDAVSLPLVHRVGWANKLRAAIAQVTPSSVLAEQHRRMAAPGSGS
jgi:hypothetical protein